MLRLGNRPRVRTGCKIVFSRKGASRFRRHAGSPCGVRLETFNEPKPFIRHPRYAQDRATALASLDLGSMDSPIVEIVAAFAQRPDCFPLQSCCGHFLCAPGQDRHTLDPIPKGYNGSVRYRIAYIALCIENGRDGRILRSLLSGISALAPECIQFGSAGWFWERCVNTYVLQVEPERYKEKDVAILNAEEARHVQRVRDRFLREVTRVLGLAKR